MRLHTQAETVISVQQANMVMAQHVHLVVTEETTPSGGARTAGDCKYYDKLFKITQTRKQDYRIHYYTRRH